LSFGAISQEQLGTSLKFDVHAEVHARFVRTWHYFRIHFVRIGASSAISGPPQYPDYKIEEGDIVIFVVGHFPVELTAIELPLVVFTTDSGSSDSYLLRTGADPGGDWSDLPPKTYESNYIHHDFIQFRKKHLR